MDANTRSINELIGLTGRQKGRRFALKNPALLIGSDECCDLRLAMDDIRSIHAMIVLGVDGPVVRVIDNEETFINDQKVHQQQRLEDKDILRFGPFQFQLRWSGMDHLSTSLKLHSTALVAQQAELTEREIEIQTHSWTEEEVSEHLEAKRLHIIELHRQLSDSRAKFRKEKAEQETHIAEQFRDLSQAFDEIDRRERAVTQEKDRVLSLRKKFIKRWNRHWSSERKRLETEREIIQQDYHNLVTDRLTFEAEREKSWYELRTGQIEFQNGLIALAQEKNLWQIQSQEREASLKVKENELVEREDLVEHREKTYLADRNNRDKKLRQMKAEIEGLESRIQNQRSILEQLEHHREEMQQESIAQLQTDSKFPLSTELPEGAIYVTTPSLSEGADTEKRDAQLTQLANELNDQRAMLIEQLDRLAIAKEFWRAEEKRIVDELESITQTIRQQEQSIQDREQKLRKLEETLDREQIQLRHQRLQLESWQSRLTVQETFWSSEKDRLQIDASTSKRNNQRLQATLERLWRKWHRDRQEEINILQEEHKRLEELRDRWSVSLMEQDQRSAEMNDQRQRLAQEEFALEQTRQSFLEEVENPILAQKRLERYRRHIQSAFAKAEQSLQHRRKEVEKETSALKELFLQVNHQLRQAYQLETEWRQKQIEVEKEQALAEQGASEHTEAITSWNQQKDIYERQIAELRDEVDRLLGLLAPESKEQTVLLGKAA